MNKDIQTEHFVVTEQVPTGGYNVYGIYTTEQIAQEAISAYLETHTDVPDRNFTIRKFVVDSPMAWTI